MWSTIYRTFTNNSKCSRKIIKSERNFGTMLTFNLKKEWFEKIKSGEKTHEYREVKPYWDKRLFIIDPNLHECLKRREVKEREIVFVNGYASKKDSKNRLYANLISIRIVNGNNTDLKINKPVYDIEFELIKEQAK